MATSNFGKLCDYNSNKEDWLICKRLYLTPGTIFYK